jgi:Flp pilus assembly protein TadG
MFQRRPRRLPVPRDRRGALTVEMALTLPIFFTIMFGAMELVRVNMVRNGLENACFEGARRASLPGATVANATAAAQTVLTACDIRGATITIAPTTITPATTEVTVSISAPIPSNLWIAPYFTRATTMSKSCTLMRERTKRPGA